MGGSGGKRERQRRVSTLGGKFQSIGSKEEQDSNRELVVRLMARIGPEGEKEVGTIDRIFLQDCKIKMNQFGQNVQFGWRQVENIVRIHDQIMAKREERNANTNRQGQGQGAKRDGTGSAGAGPAVDRSG